MRAILMYHSVDSSGSPISIAPEEFDAHVAWLASGRVRVVPFDRIADVPEDEDAVALTFDDAFRSFGDRAWPRLREHGLPATVFVVTDHVGGDNRWGGAESPGIPTLPLHDWEELGRLAEEGVELGCHSRSHPDLSRTPRERIAEELESSCEALRGEVGVDPQSFAYPYGFHGPDARDLARERFRQACTTELAPLRSSDQRHLLPRLDAFYWRDARGAARLAKWGGPAFRAHLALRAAARRVRGALRR